MTERGGNPAKKDQRPLLERPDLKPEERARIGRAVVILLGWGLVATTLLGLLALWHLVRRGRALRANLAQPRSVSLPEDDRSPRNP
jgi:type II secretory pathway component PulL